MMSKNYDAGEFHETIDVDNGAKYVFPPLNLSCLSRANSNQSPQRCAKYAHGCDTCGFGIIFKGNGQQVPSTTRVPSLR